MKDFFTALCIQFANRSTAKKKLRFLNWIVPLFQKYGYPAEIVNDKAKFGRICDVVFGDIKKAKLVVLVPYDTPQKYLFSNSVYYPVDGSKNRKVQFHNLLGQTVLSILMMVLAIGVSYLAMKQAGISRYAYIILSFFIFLIAFVFGKGIGNRYNFNRNSAAICVAMELAKKKIESTAFVFVDATAQSYKGYQLLKHTYDKLLEQKKVVFLDCIGTKDPCHILSSKPCHEDSLKAYWYQLDSDADTILSLFSHSYLLTRAVYEEEEWKVYHTGSKKDDVVDFDALEENMKILAQFMNGKSVSNR